MVRQFIHTKAIEVSDRVFRFVISDETVDRDQTVIKVGGWLLDNYTKNPIVLYMHYSLMPDPDIVVGKGLVWIENGQLWAEAHFEPEGDNPIADKLVKKLRFGSINATSVGFDPIEYSMGVTEMGEDPDMFYFRKQDLLEFSIVHIPSNPNATSKDAHQGDPGSAMTVADFVKAAKAGLKPPVPEAPPKNGTEEIKAPTGPDPYMTEFLKLKLHTL